MMKGKIVGIVIWALVFALSLILLFALSKNINGTVIVTCIFDAIAFVGSLIFIWVLQKNASTADDKFIHLPALIVSCAYMIVQIPICIVLALLSSVMPFKVALLINVIIFIIAWIIMLCSVARNDHIRKANSRQKDHHVEL